MSLTKIPKTQPLVVGNWKMQLTIEQSLAVVTELRKQLRTFKGPVQGVICPSFTALANVRSVLKGSKIKLGAQDIFWDEHGAYTGEVSPFQLQELDVEYVIIGHSERRHLFGETDAMVARKMIAALTHDLTPILCIGETGDQRRAGQHEVAVREQLTNAFRSLPPPTGKRRIYIAYEPVWAIGTGEAASPAQANDMMGLIRQTMIDLYSEGLVNNSFQILYGGSVDADNITDYVSPGHYQGALVGSASLKADSFATMIHAVSQSFTS